MILCPSCKTLNPESESQCLACQAPLSGGGGGASRTVVETGTDATARCPNGHPIDPSWTSCPYCSRPASSSTATRIDDAPASTDGGAAGSRKTRLEATGLGTSEAGGRRTRLSGEPSTAPPSAPPKPPSAPRKLRTTRLEEPAGGQTAQRRTVLRPAGGAAAPSPQPGPAPQARPPAAPAGDPARKLVAVLAAPGLRPGGAVFAVREGKNRIGASSASEICLQDDTQVSSEHALLLYRGGAFHLADCMSTNGTLLNGEELTGTHSIELADRDHIRCGATDLIFLALGDSASGDAAAAAAADPAAAEEQG